MSKAGLSEERAILRMSGGDAEHLLQDLVTNNITSSEQPLVYTALLTPQGKFAFDFFVLKQGQDLLLDVSADRAQALLARLNLYKLRADVTLEMSEIKVALGTGFPPSRAHQDPRHALLGWRLYSDDLEAKIDGQNLMTSEEYTALRVEALVPEAGKELLQDQSFILEMGFERLSGVDFRKGCYVGQEVTARMKHKTELRKGLARVALHGQGAVEGAEILVNERKVGALHSIAGSKALAHLRLDRVEDVMLAGDVVVSLETHVFELDAKS